MEKIGYTMFFIGALGFAGLLVYGAYTGGGLIPALIVFFFELISTGIILTQND